MEHWYGVDGECEIRWQQKKNKQQFAIGYTVREL
jgi:hypothetical protein